MIHHTLCHSCQACVHECVYNTSFLHHKRTYIYTHTQDYDPQGSSLQFTDNGSMLYKGYKIGDRGVLTPDGPGPSSGLKILSLSLSHTHLLSLSLSLQYRKFTQNLLVCRHHNSRHSFPRGNRSRREQYCLQSARCVCMYIFIHV